VQAELRRCGAIYKEEGVVRDGNMITAKGPQQADEFAGCLIEALVSE
jgi:putative intracellular protease/amidase